MNTEFNIADLENALSLIEANPMFHTDNKELADKKGVGVYLYEYLFIAGAKTLACALVDGLDEDGVKERINMFEASVAVAKTIGRVVSDGEEARMFVSSLFSNAVEAVNNDR